MYQEKLDALNESIEYWEGISEGCNKGIGGDNCALCQYTKAKDLGCTECPIYGLTGKEHCQNTPYYKFKAHYSDEHSDYVGVSEHIVCNTCDNLVDDEIELLKKVREDFVKKNKKKLFLKIRNPETAIGDENVGIIIVDENGIKINQGCLALIDREGELVLASSIGHDADASLKLDSMRAIVTRNE